MLGDAGLISLMFSVEGCSAGARPISARVMSAEASQVMGMLTGMGGHGDQV